ncbi:hypothetical protein SLEP1_g7443 [Rubroshorea leprosula]|uniref:NADP-dependent oxidoreductase domain-containing protein n=1 Tax=Rubroshorea leprosula TaxID=152421 RepID=A0AAV5I469_9ROSI|nr:hypothetical protein SLEP1_g7443 [Rubroshorea leprosula]
MMRKLNMRPLQCVLEQDKRRAVVKNGKDSLDICRLVNGMWQTKGEWGAIDHDNAVDAMLRYADAGLTTFDMADIYGPAEDLYGIFINRVRRERPPEYWDKIRGLTKWVPPPVKITSSFVRESINVSRKRMDVSSLDMLQFHWVGHRVGNFQNVFAGFVSFVLMSDEMRWDYSNPGYLDALKHLTDLKEEGLFLPVPSKIKTLALTNFDTERLQIVLENGIPIVSNQVQHSIVDMRPQQKMVELCQLSGVKLITYGTVMGGLLSEKFLDTNLDIPFAGPPLNTPSLQKYRTMVDAWGGWSLFQTLLQTLKKISSKHGVSIPTVAVKYILDQPAVAGSMVGVRLGLSEHIQDTNSIFSLILDEEDVNSIQEIYKRGKDLLKIAVCCLPVFCYHFCRRISFLPSPCSQKATTVEFIGTHLTLVANIFSGSFVGLNQLLTINNVEPFCQDELVLYRQCAERRDKELRQRLKDSEGKLGLSMPLEQAKERASEPESEVTGSQHWRGT